MANEHRHVMQAVKRQKVEIEIIPDDAEGEIDLDALESLLKDGHGKAALIAITHAPTSSGAFEFLILHYDLNKADFVFVNNRLSFATSNTHAMRNLLSERKTNILNLPPIYARHCSLMPAKKRSPLQRRQSI